MVNVGRFASLATAAVVVGLGSACFVAGLAGAAQHPQSSLFTSIELETCKALKKYGSGKGWMCQALLPLYAEDRDGHFFLAIGPEARDHKAAKQTLQAANTPIDRKSKRITVEWRVKARGAGPQPYASIVRYFTQAASGRPGEVLVVTRIGERQSCHVAYIDALANADAIVLARAAADDTAPSFDCKVGEPTWIGRVGPP